MRLLWILPVFWALFLPGSARSDEGQDGGFQPRQEISEPEALDPAEFQPIQPLGTFQPTDIGDSSNPQQQAPGALAPAVDAEPIRQDADSGADDVPSQTVAPAQFQSPSAPKAKSPEPKTTVVPAANAPAFQPVTPGNQSTPPSQPALVEPQNLAQSLYQQSAAPPPTGAIEGVATTLQEALTRRTDPARFAEFVTKYWRLSQSLASYHDALQGGVELVQLPTPRAPYQQALLQRARTAAEAEVRQARLGAIASQWELAEQMTGEAVLPLPTDVPLTAAYKSKFEAVFAGRAAPVGARRLDATFGPRLAVVEGRAAAVVAAENAFAAAADSYANGQIDLAAALGEHSRLQSARREFLQSVYEYNVDIAEYAWLAAGPNRTPETIAGMLVERKKPAGEPASTNLAAPAAKNVVQKPQR
jgi:hypothetical protein